ncbi:MAG: NADH-quinone oxidoreductase subunit N, partial [Pseudonocardia sp.]|nr:NADH-quinone oxidoreductase subunit N [Pseudonocardia sp.]
MAQGVTAELPTIAYYPLAPVLIILSAASIGVLVEAFLPRHQRWATQVTLALLALVVSGVVLGAYAVGGAKPMVTLAGAISVDRPTLFLWGTLLALAFGGVLLIADRSVEPGGSFITDAAGVEPARIAVGAGVGAAGNGVSAGRNGEGPVRTEVIPPGTPQDRITAGRAGMQTEVLPLTLFALGGMMAFCAANDLLTMFVALEVLSLPLYLLCGLARRRRLLSQEAAVKYFLLGAFASAFFLYGLALLYGYAGSVKLADIATASAGTQRSDTL